MLVLTLAACGDPLPDVDTGARDAGPRLDAAGDASGDLDAETITDRDAPVAPDLDAGSSDTGSSDAPPSLADAGPPDVGGPDVGGPDVGPPDVGPPDAPSGPLVFDVRVLADRACSDLSFDPPRIDVPEGTSFTVRWINATGCTPIDIDKSGTVPIVIGLEAGASYHDTVREWCGTLFTGTFFFRAYYAPSFPYYLDVDCSR